tara:strand:+ start:384 stop:638 length:255 start_codon:yes stop_codon:yes gene_type:complete
MSNKKQVLKKSPSQIALDKMNKARTEARLKISKLEADEKGKFKCKVSKDCGAQFGTDSIEDGSELNLPKETLVDLLVLGFVTVK